MAWRYIATRLNGDGTETPLSWDVPLQSPKVTEDLSGPGGITGTVSPELRRLKVDGAPLFLPWSTAIYAEADGYLRGGGILTGLTLSGPDLDLDCVGFSGYLQGQPYTGDSAFVMADPLDVARAMWADKQAVRGGNLGLQLGADTTDIRIGTPAEPVEWGDVDEVTWNWLMAKGWKGDPKDGKEMLYPPDAATGTDADDPYVLNHWSSHDLGNEFDKLAAETPFDYRVVHEWDGDTIRHQMRLGHPTLGARRGDLRFVVGENVFTEPQVNYSGDEYASEVIVLGAGEGRTMVRGAATTVPTRLHRAVVQSDKTITSATAARSMAEAEVRARLGGADISELVVLDHSHAPIGSYAVGDEIRVQTAPGWADNLDLWVRILSTTIEPDQGTCTLTVARTEKVT